MLERGLLSNSYLKEPLIWMKGAPLKRARTAVPVIRDEVQAKPLPGERRRKLLTESGELQAGNDRLLEVWTGHIHEILKECRAPVLVQLEGSRGHPTGWEHACYYIEEVPHHLQEMAAVAMRQK